MRHYFRQVAATPDAVSATALLFVGGLATEVPRIGKRCLLRTANNRIRSNIRANLFRGIVGWPMARLHHTPIDVGHRPVLHLDSGRHAAHRPVRNSARACAGSHRSTPRSPGWALDHAAHDYRTPGQWLAD